MQTKFKAYSVCLYGEALIIFLILASSTTFAAPLQNNPFTINETQITTSESGQYYPNIYDDRIVWFDSRNTTWEIHVYNLSISRETSIPINGTRSYSPVIYGSRIVWGDVIFPDEYPLPVVYLYDFSTSEQIQISAKGAAMSPAISEDRIVWMDSRNNGKKDYSDPATKWDIYIHNLSTSTETQLFLDEQMKFFPVICEDRLVWTDPFAEGRINCWNLARNRNTFINLSAHNRSSQMFPVIYKDRIVWMDNRNGGRGNYWNLTGNWDVYMYNLSTHKEIQITNDESMQAHPAIYEDNIVWIDSRDGYWEIYGYNLTTSKEIRITDNRPWPYYHPAIYENRVVWMSSGNWEVYMYDLSTSKETQITTNSLHLQNPAPPSIFGNRIVWESERNGNKDIYMYTVSVSAELMS